MQVNSFENRRHDVDWLRVLALALLILYHLGMYYVHDWGWHVKSEQQSEWLQALMLWSNKWRMSLLFFVSGMTLAIIADKYRSFQLLKLRSLRLLVPLIFGMYIIVPPQLYYELLANGQALESYSSFWLQYIDLDTQLARERHSIIGLLTWNHLWYLAYLWCYSCLFLLLKPALSTLVKSAAFQRLPGYIFAFLVALVLFLTWYFLRKQFPTTHDLINDWFNHAKYIGVMLVGYLFVYRTDVWQKVINYRRRLMLVGTCTYLFLATDHFGMYPNMAELFKNNLSVQIAYGSIAVVNLWTWLLCMVGYAGRYLNKSSALLSYCNKAILPWYILHQSLIVVFAANLQSFALPAGLEALVILLLTVLTCFISYEIIKRLKATRFLFGLKV